jgi:hypothetical protein
MKVFLKYGAINQIRRKAYSQSLGLSLNRVLTIFKGPLFISPAKFGCKKVRNIVVPF